MKVKIGPFQKHHSFLRLIKLYVKLRHKKEHWDFDLAEGDWLDRTIDRAHDNIIIPFCDATINRYNEWRGRKIKIKIDNYDVWGMDHTLAYIIHPMLIKLKKKKQGAPFVDPEDVPEELRPTDEMSDENGYTDNTHFERWEWVLDEMIWTFEIYNTDWEMDYYTPPEGQWSIENRGTFDLEGRKKMQDRIENGLRLFGKYYQSLWT